MSRWNKLRSWLRGVAPAARAARGAHAARACRPVRARPALERLEDRLAPATGMAADFRPIIELGAAQAAYPYRGDGYSVAVLDTGIDYNNPDLGGGWGKRVIAGWNFVGNNANPMDDNGHGTFVAGEIASSSTLYPGIAPDVNLIDLKVLDANNQGSWANIDSALQWVVNHQAQYHIVAVNLSLGSGNYTTNPYNMLEGDFTALTTRGVFISVASGNGFYDNHSQPGLAYPAVSPNVVSVGATWAGNFGPVTFQDGATDTSTTTDQLLALTQRDSSLDILAPGAWLTSDAVGGGYRQYGGTSMAAAVVTGAAVLMHQAYDTIGLPGDATQANLLHLMQATGAVVTDNNPNTNTVPTGLSFRRLDLKAALDAIPKPMVFAAVADQTVAPGGSVVVPLSTVDPAGAPVTYTATVDTTPARAWLLRQQYNLYSSGNYYTNLDGENEKWIHGTGGAWFWVLPGGDLRRWAGSVTNTLLPANDLATLNDSYYQDPSKLYNAPFVPNPPATVSVSGNRLTITAPSPTWTGSAVVTVTATDGLFTAQHTFTVNAQVPAAVALPPVVGPLPNRTVTHSQRPLVLTLSATDPAGKPVTFTAQVQPAGGSVPPVTASVQGNQLTLVPALSFVGTYTVVVTASDGSASATASFTVTVTNAAPQLAAVAEQTMATGVNTLTVPLSATDADGDALTYSAQVLAPDPTVYKLNQQLGLAPYKGSYYTNIWGAGDKWLVGYNNIWYGIFPDGKLYRWAGTFAQTVQPANLVATLDPVYYAEPRLLWQAAPPVAPAITAAVPGNQLTLQRPAGLVGAYLVQVAVSDGAATAQRTFILALN